MKKHFSLLTIAMFVGLIAVPLKSAYTEELTYEEQDQPGMMMQEEEMDVAMPVKEQTDKEKISITKRIIRFLKAKQKQVDKQAAAFDTFMEKNQDKLDQKHIDKLTAVQKRFNSLSQFLQNLIEKKEAYLEKMTAK